MKRLLVFFAVCLMPFFMLSQTDLYVHPNADTYVANTKTIAILPLKVQVNLSLKELKDFTQEQMIAMSKNEALEIQKATYFWFLKRELKVQIQDPQKTNELLKNNGIDIHDYDSYTSSELGAILGVETIVTGTFETSKLLSNGVVVGLAVLTGYFGPTNSTTLNMEFKSTTDNVMVVKYLKNVRGTVGSNMQDQINKLMRKVSRRIPYTK
jgi:hypothetical protein